MIGKPCRYNKVSVQGIFDKLYEGLVLGFFFCYADKCIIFSKIVQYMSNNIAAFYAIDVVIHLVNNHARFLRADVFFMLDWYGMVYGMVWHCMV